MSHPKTALDTNLLSNTTLPTVVFGPNRAHTYYGHATDCPCGAAGFPCTRWGTIDWCPTNSLGLHYANAASEMHPSACISMVLAYSLMAFFALRTMIRTSTTALIGLSLIVGGLIYDVNLGFTGVAAAEITETTITSAAVLASNTSISSVNAVSRHLSGWECGVIGQWCSGQRSGAMSKLALPGFWLMMLVVVVCWLGLASGQLRDAATASPKAPQSIDGEQLDNSLTTKATKTTALPEQTDEPAYSVEYRPLAGGIFAHTVKVKRSNPVTKDEESKDLTTVQDTRPGTTKLAVLFALFLLALVLVPMALAEPTSTSMSSTSLSLPSPTPTTTEFDAVATLNQSLGLQEKDKPQTWFYHPHNSALRAAEISILAMAISALLFVWFIVLPLGDPEHMKAVIAALPSTTSSPSPSTTAFDTTTTAVNAKQPLELQQRYVPMIPNYTPQNASSRISIRSMLLAITLLVMAYFFVPALATGLQTTMPATHLTLPSSSPCTTAFNASGTTLSALELQQKDKPQTWYYNPHKGGSSQASISALSMMIPLLVMGYFLTSAFAADVLAKDNEVIDHQDLPRQAPPPETSPVWEIYYSTTTVYPPAVTVASPSCAPGAPATGLIGVAGNDGGHDPYATEICTEKNPAVCPIVLGRKAWGQ